MAADCSDAAARPQPRKKRGAPAPSPGRAASPALAAMLDSALEVPPARRAGRRQRGGKKRRGQPSTSYPRLYDSRPMEVNTIA